MRRFLYFIIFCSIIFVAVFYYAQSLRGKQETISAIDWTSQLKDKIISTQNDQTAKKQVSNIPLDISITKNPVYIFRTQKITIQTDPNIDVRLVVAYPNGSINNGGTVTGQSDKKGKFSVEWLINTSGALGQAKIKASVGGGNKFAEKEATFKIINWISKNSSATLPPIFLQSDLPN